MTPTSPDNKLKVALYPGTFDPFTIGHLSILKRGLKLFDQIVIAVGINDAKPFRESLEERMNSISSVVAGMDRVKVTSYQGLTVDAARRENALFILRGIRSAADYEYERSLAQINYEISGIETVLLYARPELAHVSSSMVRDLEKNGFDASSYLPSSNDKGK